MSKVWFTSDTHFGHSNIIKHSNRPFGDVHEMNHVLMEGINQHVEPDDVLYHLGDFAWDLRMLPAWRTQIECKNVHLIWGNHDKNRSAHERVFQTVDKVAWLSYRTPIWLSHYAHASWPGSSHGSWHLYGHSHGTLEAKMDEAFPGRNSMDVGVDQAAKVLGEYRPFSFEEVEKILKEKGNAEFRS